MNGAIIPVNNDPTDYTTDGLTFTNCTYQDGGYCVQGNLVLVYIRVRADVNTSFTVQGFPKAKGATGIGGWPPRMTFQADSPVYLQARTSDTYIFTYGTVTQNTVYGIASVYLKG